METPETEHQARIRKLLEESDEQYEAELERQNKIIVAPETITDIIGKPQLPLVDEAES